MAMPFVLEAAALLTALIRPNRIDKLCSWGLIHLSPHCNSNYSGYISVEKVGRIIQIPMLLALVPQLLEEIDGH
ncbi:MAG TPA: hypothetical protein DEB62_11565 [Vibrio sp.]|nr:hypothetical protein [Vibrio sp.]